MTPEERVLGPKGGAPETSKVERFRAFATKWGSFLLVVAGTITVATGVLGYGISCLIKDDLSAVGTGLENKLGERIDGMEASLEEKIETLGETDEAIKSDLSDVAEDVSYMSGVLDVIRENVNALLTRENGGRPGNTDNTDDAPSEDPR